MYVQGIVVLIVVLWLTALTVGLFLFFNFFRKLTKGSKELDLVKVLTRILSVQNDNSNEIINFQKRQDLFEEEGRVHLQKMALVRFNPFSETGGDHSFCLTLLDGKNTGVVITGLHTRERTRVYIKPVKSGKSDIELSSEENKSLEKAMRS